MSQVILTNWTIFFADDAPAGSSGHKQIMWTGGGAPETNTNTVNELYSEINHYMSLSTNNNFDDTTPIRAVTPTVYEIGSFDSGDLEPWFIDPDSIRHLTGGSIQTVNWTRVTGTGTNAGIIKVAYDTITTDFVASDIGRAIANGSATGTIVWIDVANSEVWIRPTDSTSTHDWSTASGTISVTGSSASVDQAVASVTGEKLWSNIRTIGTIADNTRIYVTQDNIDLVNFWGDGAINRLYLINDGFDAGLIGDGVLTVYARQFSKTFDYFISDVSGGGQTIVPLSTGSDLNNLNGIRSVTVTTASSNFVAGDVVTGGTTGAQGVVRSNTGNPTTSFEYYLIGDVATDFNSSETLSSPATGANGSTSGAPSNVGPATYTDVTVTFGEELETFNCNTGVNGGTEVITTDTTHPFTTGDVVNYSKDSGIETVGLTEGTLYYVNNISTTTLSLHTSKADAIGDLSRVDLTSVIVGETHILARTYDLDEDSTNDPFSIVINGGGRILSQIYERLKYITRRGESTTLNGIEGQQYIGIDYKIFYATLTGAISVGDTVTQANDLTLSATVVHHNKIDKYIMVRDVVNAPFDTSGSAPTFGVDGSNNVVMTTASVEAITPLKVSPFGTFAGGTFFGARGVYLENVAAADANKYFLTDDDGNVLQPPTSVPLTITVEDESGDPVEGARCRIETDPAGTLITNGETNASGVYSDTYVYSIDVDVNVVVRLKGFLSFRTTGVISDSGLNVSVRFITDTIVD